MAVFASIAGYFIILVDYMKWILGIAFLGSFSVLSSCSNDNASSTTEENGQDKSVAAPVFDKQRVPSSRRSRAAIAKVAPSLVRDLAEKELSYGAPVFIRIFKEEKELEVWLEQGEVFKHFCTYEIAGLSGTLGPKQREGDRQAPEGFYYVTPSRMNPHSRFHLSFDLGYPNAYDRAHQRTGSAIMVHGNQASIGCFAMTDAKIEEIYALADAALRNGQKFFRVHCFPFRMTARNMGKHRRSKWITFWENLQTGYVFFERTKQPPNVLLRNKKYVFESIQQDN
jgi:murein L,D-transpeptidase YafK